MLLLNSRPTQVHHYHHGDYGRGGGGRDVWGSSPRHGRSSRNDEGLTGGERVGAVVVGVAAATAAVAAYDCLDEQLEDLRKPLEKTQRLQGKWNAQLKNSEPSEMEEKLLKVFKAQEKVEQTRVSRALKYKWSSVVTGIGGVVLVVGAILNVAELVVIGAVVVAAALTFAGMTWLISCFRDAADPAKKVHDDYAIVARQFLGLREVPLPGVSVLPEAPPAYSA